MTQSVNELINHKAVYRTAPATPGLLNSEGFAFSFELFLLFISNHDTKFVHSLQENKL